MRATIVVVNVMTLPFVSGAAIFVNDSEGTSCNLLLLVKQSAGDVAITFKFMRICWLRFPGELDLSTVRVERERHLMRCSLTCANMTWLMLRICQTTVAAVAPSPAACRAPQGGHKMTCVDFMAYHELQLSLSLGVTYTHSTLQLVHHLYALRRNATDTQVLYLNF